MIFFNFQITPDASAALRQYFSGVQGDDGFGNGRGVRNVFENATVRRANRVASIRNPSHDHLTVLTEADVAINFSSETLEIGSDQCGDNQLTRVAFSEGDGVFPSEVWLWKRYSCRWEQAACGVWEEPGRRRSSRRKSLTASQASGSLIIVNRTVCARWTSTGKSRPAP